MFKKGDKVTSKLWPAWRGVVAKDQEYQTLISIDWHWSQDGPSVEFVDTIVKAQKE